MPWNSAVKSRSAGSSSGEKPKQRMPSVENDFASVPPLIRYGSGTAIGSSALSAADMASTRSPSNDVSTAMSRTSVSRSTCSPSSSSMVASSSSSCPGRKRQSIVASAVDGMTLVL